MMFWSIVTVIVAGFIIVTFLIPVFAAIIFGAEIAHDMSEERHERMRPSIRARWSSPDWARGPVCPWTPHKAANAR